MIGTPSGRRRPVRFVLALAGLTLVLTAATACASDGGGSRSGSPSPVDSQAPGAAGSPTATPMPTPAPSTTPKPLVVIPTDCRAMLSAEVLAQLGATPLNDPAAGNSGPQADGEMICIWADPAAGTAGLKTEITRMNSGPALEMLNALADDEGFICYTPDDGTRCEKEFPNPQYPVTDGRTLYFRDDVLIDTTYSNLAPTGYTGSIVDHIWP
ncbi:hypothetical protein ACPW96_17365 [Micromonospora sp. DT81.3]|uniref:hypothetical protein n=1 Tax=Micromonospora sp. DT81.3 TaxID=3416523 RepID=UPI003CF14A56